MAIKRALVVDDSRSARVALKKLLEEHELQVDLAESGEAALEFLKKDTVDVVFMDHTMPGMDGLEAVSAIKANPDTATIPVMMYTTKEGEVYVGQARALGAVGVLPKNVQPHQLFEMLLQLGLVKERRGVARTSDEPEDVHAALADVDRALEDQAMGISVQNVVTRILEDQHLTLRADILRSQKTFAKEVAHEVLKEQALAADNEPDLDDELERETAPAPRRRMAAAALVIGLVVSSFLAWQFKAQRDATMAQLVALEADRVASTDAALAELRGQLDGAQSESATVVDAALAALAWTVNQDNTSNMDEPAFSGALAERVRGVLPYLADMGFSGELVLNSHLGRFCLTVDEVGNYQLAPDDLPMLECDYVGHVMEDASYVSDRLSVEFSELLAEQASGEPRLRLQALDGEASQVFAAYPGPTATAGEWNAVARLNNRVQVRFQPEPAIAQN